MKKQEWRVRATNYRGTTWVVGFGMRSKADAEECADEFRTDEPTNMGKPVTYTVEPGGTPDNNLARAAVARAGR